jgi:hypothetical protein
VETILRIYDSNVFGEICIGALSVAFLFLGSWAIWLMLEADGGTETHCPTCGQSVSAATSSKSTLTDHQD